MKALKIIKSIVLWILACIFFGFVIIMTILLLNFNDFGITQFGDKSLIIIDDKVSSEKYEKGDLLIVNAKELDKIEVGNELFAYKLDEKGAAHVEFGKVGDIYIEEDAIAFENGDTYSMKFVIGESEKKYSDIGTYLSIVESKWGFLFMILVPSFLIFIYQIYSLIVEIKYGGDE